MKIVDEAKGFLFRKRSWPYLAGALALMVIGPMLEGVSVLDWLARITLSLENGLRSVEPFAIAGAVLDAIHGHSGLWFCPPVDTSGGCGGPLFFVNAGLATLFALPRVALTVLREGGIVPAILYLTTLLLMGTAIVLEWKDLGKPDSGLIKTIFVTLMILIFGPIVGGVFFWILRLFLLLLVVFFGKVIAGLIWCAVTFQSVFKVAQFCIELLKKSDEVKERVSLFSGHGAVPPTTPPIEPK